MKKYSLFELQIYLKRVITLNFQEPLWVIAEISQIRHNRGHLYLELIEKKDDGQEVCAQCQAIIWSKNLVQIKQSLGDTAEELLCEGTEVSLLTAVTFHPVYGLKLSVLDVDAGYTLGKMELERQQTILRLKKEGLLQLNSMITPPMVLQRIAVISSADAAGYQDFVQHLHNNDYGYFFELRLFSSAVQGKQLEEDVQTNLDAIARDPSRFDCVVIIRGGGSKLDLAGFDRYNIARSISQCALPVFTGIGHETDTTVADLVACRSFKTPTAVANYLIDQNINFEANLQQTHHLILQKGSKLLIGHKERLLMSRQRIAQSLMRHLQNEQHMLTNYREKINLLIKRELESAKIAVSHLVEKISLLNPREILRKGYSLTLHKGIIVRESQSLKPGDPITTLFHDGRVESTVDQIKLHP